MEKILFTAKQSALDKSFLKSPRIRAFVILRQFHLQFFLCVCHWDICMIEVMNCFCEMVDRRKVSNPIWKVLTIVNTTSRIWTWVQKQPTEVFYKKAVLKNFAVFTGKQLCWTLFLLKSERLLLWVQSLLNRDAQ